MYLPRVKQSMTQGSRAGFLLPVLRYGKGRGFDERVLASLKKNRRVASDGEQDCFRAAEVLGFAIKKILIDSATVSPAPAISERGILRLDQPSLAMRCRRSQSDRHRNYWI